MTPSQIRRRLTVLNAQEHAVSVKITALQADCPHATPTYKYRASTGGYDGPSSDDYWMEWQCPDCGRRWTTEQTNAALRAYPNAVNVTRA